MQKLIVAIFLIIGINAFTQGTAGIYKFKVNIDQRLTNQFIVNNANQNQLNIPDVLNDSLVSFVKRLVTQEVFAKTQWLFPLNRKSEQKKTRSSSTQLGDMPRGTKRQAMKTEYLEYYVKFKIRVGVNKTMTVGNQIASYSRLKPYVRVKMKAYGVDRRVKRRKQIRLGGFKGIGSVNMNIGGTTMTQTNALPIEEIMDMIFKGLVKFEKKVK
jgi:hypothetical protein